MVSPDFACRIDIITQISGVEFEQAHPKRKEIEIDGIKLPVISKEDLILNKESTGREKDKLDSKYMKSYITKNNKRTTDF
ncbi:MAG: hypothetical protein JXA96_17795 [Sedimentisphaerales bacterium]|nr:hypothetical protein [Sedimentisphaerales bacterium]